MLTDLLLKLGKKGLGSIVNLVTKKGTDILKAKTGIDLSKDSISDEEIEELKLYQENNRPEILRLTNELELGLQKEATTRHATDMLSDSIVSKNVRPATLIYFSLVYSVMIGVKIWFIKSGVDASGLDNLFTGVEGFLNVIFGFYFSSRAIVGLAKVFKK